MKSRIVKTIYNGVAALTVGILVLSCSVGRNYSRPELGMPDAYSGPATETDSSIARVSWDEFFTDTTLQGLIRRALTHNRSEERRVGKGWRARWTPEACR